MVKLFHQNLNTYASSQSLVVLERARCLESDSEVQAEESLSRLHRRRQQRKILQEAKAGEEVWDPRDLGGRRNLHCRTQAQHWVDLLDLGVEARNHTYQTVRAAGPCCSTYNQSIPETLCVQEKNDTKTSAQDCSLFKTNKSSCTYPNPGPGGYGQPP